MNAHPPGTFALAIVLAVSLAPFVSAGESKKAPKGAPEAVKALKEAMQLLNSRQIDQGIEKLQALVLRFPGDPAADKAKDLLRENGVGDEIRVRLLKSEVFRDKLKITERSILELGEKVLKELSGQYKALKEPYFKSSLLELQYFDSQARYREKGGIITSAGQFRVTATSNNPRAMEGRIEWYYTQEGGTLKDRQTALKGLFYHEMTHYQNAVHFGRGILPQVIEEGLATYIDSRLNTEVYQNYRSTERQRMEAIARDGLSSLTRFEDFVSLLDAPRALGRGDSTVNRWYGQCYSIVDFMAEEVIGERKTSLDDLLKLVEKLSAEKRERMNRKNTTENSGPPTGKKAPAGKQAPVGKQAPAAKAAPEDAPADQRPPGRAFVEDLVKEIYDVKLEEFHKQLLKRVMAKYKQL